MKVKLIGINGNDEDFAYYRKLGIYGFDFVYGEEYATNLGQEQVNRIVSGSSWYCRMYGADRMEIIK